jgi:hypothetical protein
MTRSFFIGLILVTWSAAAMAGTRDDVMSGAMRCGGIADDRTWLDCFYGSAQPMRRQLNLPPAPASQTVLVPAAPAGDTGKPIAAVSAPVSQARRSGFWDGILGGAVVVNAIPAKEYSFDRDGYFTITLADGEVWRQVDDSSHARWREPASHYLVTIRQGALNSNNLKVPDDGQIYKVRRIH